MRRVRTCAVLALVVGTGHAWAQTPERTTVREYRRVIRTYPYSDPNPIAEMGRIYPYFRFDTYTDRPVDREWTVVELENRHLRVVVMPEIGGKIWTAVEKGSGRAFLYDNDVVKFRDIAMRGPWTSGGIEANYGIIGHTPNCATPVDYVTRTDADGSASVVVGALDLLTRTPWRLEITLPPDVAYFTTRSFWFNATPLEQPYYSWMNAAIKAAGGLQLIFPGTHYIGHAGEVGAWPEHPDTGRDLSYYDQNDFGSYKSYHVLGTRTEFFGAYWHDDDFGMGRYSSRDDKLGKKIWIWGLSDQGMIWERLLTDGRGQYVEVQSGRLFNQAAEGSSRTPFKNRGFPPHATDAWTEYWFPVRGTKGLVDASPFGGLNVRREGERVTVSVSPLQRVSDTLEVYDGETLVSSRPVRSEPMRPWSLDVPHTGPADRLRVVLRRHRLAYSGRPATQGLARPLTSPPRFDWASAYGAWLKGKELIRQRSYAAAEAAIEASLRVDPHFAPSLVDLAMLRHRALDHAAARDAARRALAIDAYEPGANYYYALANLELGALEDARDGFEVAAQSSEFRVASWNGLARLSLRQGDLDRAEWYASRSVGAAADNLEGHQLLAVVARLRGRTDTARRATARLLRLDPLNHFARFERALAAPGATARQAFVAGVRNELPHETYLELAAWYQGVGRTGEASEVVALAPPAAEVLYWRAFLEHGRGRSQQAAALLGQADAASPRLVFPFRAESAAVFEWAAGASADWRPKYYLALIHWSRHNLAQAREWFERCGNAPDFAPFYAARAAVRTATPGGQALDDLLRAASLDPAEWRIGLALAEEHLRTGHRDRALEVARGYYDRAPQNYHLGMLLARVLIASEVYAEAAGLLGRLQVLPYEGSTDGRRLYRQAHLMLAVEAMRAGEWDRAGRSVELARQWPPNLGAGKPYPDDVDERLEDYLDAQRLEAVGRRAEAAAVLTRVAGRAARGPASGVLVSALALRDLGRGAEGLALLDRIAVAGDGGTQLEWSRRALQGDVGPVPRDASEEHVVLAAWLQGQR